jgi:hyperpolarization activated cyclic nucleotide-gated potassium channel 2
VISYKKIWLQYFKGWFILDFVSIFPFDILVGSNSQTNYNNLVRLLRLPRLYRLTKIIKLSSGGSNSFITRMFSALELNSGKQ